MFDLERHRDGAAAQRQRGEQALVQQRFPQMFAPEQPVTRVGGPWQPPGRLALTRVDPTLDAALKVAKTYPTQAKVKEKIARLEGKVMKKRPNVAEHHDDDLGDDIQSIMANFQDNRDVDSFKTLRSFAPDLRLRALRGPGGLSSKIAETTYISNNISDLVRTVDMVGPGIDTCELNHQT